VLHRESTILKSAMMPVKLVCRRISVHPPHVLALTHGGGGGGGGGGGDVSARSREMSAVGGTGEDEGVEGMETHTVLFV
jgi:hypothetical protein